MLYSTACWCPDAHALIILYVSILSHNSAKFCRCCCTHLAMFVNSEIPIKAYMASSNIRFDMSIPMGSIFGIDRDRYCRHMFERADLHDANIDSWHMWRRASKNVVACKFCRLYTACGYIRHECGWWERTGHFDTRICFCFCHDDLGYALNDGDSFMFCDSETTKKVLSCERRDLLHANELHIDNIIGWSPDLWITYVACRDGDIILSDHDTGALHPSQILSIRAFSGFMRQYAIFKAKVQVYRGTTLGQFMSMQSKRYFQRCSQCLWILGDDKETAIIMHLQVLCLRAVAPYEL